MQKHYWTYIMASARNGTLYIGVTNDLSRRVWEHREGLVSGFTKKYGVKMLVYFEIFEDVNAAIHQEKTLEEMETALEAGIDRKTQSRMARSYRIFERLNLCHLDGPLLRAMTTREKPS